MDKSVFQGFERITRRAHFFTNEEITIDNINHPFDDRNIHLSLPDHIRDLFDNGHYAQSTFETFKFLDREVARISKSNESGYKLMMAAFNDQKPLIQLNDLKNRTMIDEQKGYQFLFAGSIMAIRNPRGHEYKIFDDMEECLDYLSLITLLLRRIEKAGYTITSSSS